MSVEKVFVPTLADFLDVPDRLKAKVNVPIVACPAMPYKGADRDVFDILCTEWEVSLLDNTRELFLDNLSTAIDMMAKHVNDAGLFLCYPIVSAPITIPLGVAIYTVKAQDEDNPIQLRFVVACEGPSEIPKMDYDGLPIEGKSEFKPGRLRVWMTTLLAKQIGPVRAVKIH